MASKNFSQVLKGLRLKAGHTQKEVYEHFKIPQSTFSSWEVGKSEPSGEMLIQLCEFYKCNMMKELSQPNDDIPNSKELALLEKYAKINQIQTFTPEGIEVANAYEHAPLRDKNIVRVALGLELTKI